MASKRVTRSISRAAQRKPDMVTSSTSIADLGPELLNAIFCRVGPSPMFLASLPCVCKDWRSIVRDETWKYLCLKNAPGVCTALGCSGQVAPAGGWAALYKLLSFCPGLNPSSYEAVCSSLDYPPGWFNLVGHVRSGASGFQTGPDVAHDLRFKEPFDKDTLFVTDLCTHLHELPPDCGVSRGFVVDFPKSHIARQVGASEYLESSLEQQQLLRSKAKHKCVYCKAPLFELTDSQFFRNDFQISTFFAEYDFDAFDLESGGYATSGYVCGNGHLALAMFGDSCVERHLPEQNYVGDTGEKLVLEASAIISDLCENFAPSFDEAGGELKFRQSIDPFSISKRLERLSDAVLWERSVDEGFDDTDEEMEAEEMEDYREMLREDLDHAGNYEWAADTNSEGEGSGEQEDVILWDERATAKFLSTQPYRKLVAEDLRLRKQTRRLLADFANQPEEAPEVLEKLDRKMDEMDLDEIDLDEVDLDEFGLDESDLEDEWPSCLPSESLEVLSDEVYSITGSAEIVRMFLVKRVSVDKTTGAIQALQALNAKRMKVKLAIERASERRRVEIEAALKKAGIPKHVRERQSIYEQWPDAEAVCDYVEEGELSVEEVIRRQRIQLEAEKAEKRAKEDAGRRRRQPGRLVTRGVKKGG